GRGGLGGINEDCRLAFDTQDRCVGGSRMNVFRPVDAARFRTEPTRKRTAAPARQAVPERFSDGQRGLAASLTRFRAFQDHADRTLDLVRLLQIVVDPETEPALRDASRPLEVHADPIAVATNRAQLYGREAERLLPARVEKAVEPDGQSSSQS